MKQDLEKLVTVQVINPRRGVTFDNKLFNKRGERITTRRGFMSRRAWLTVRVKPSRLRFPRETARQGSGAVYVLFFGLYRVAYVVPKLVEQYGNQLLTPRS
jgi:hypothetical protein